MKGLLTIFVLLAVALVAQAEGRTCKDCPEGKPCTITKPAGDGCNTCTSQVWCSADHWYERPGQQCTMSLCGTSKDREIPNPMPKKK